MLAPLRGLSHSVHEQGGGGGTEKQGNILVALTCPSCILQLLFTFCKCLTSSQLHLPPPVAQAGTSVGLYLLCRESTSPQTRDLFLKALEDGVLLLGSLTEFCSCPVTPLITPHSPTTPQFSIFRNSSLWAPLQVFISFYAKELCAPPTLST